MGSHRGSRPRTLHPPLLGWPSELLRSAASQYRLDRWEGQSAYVEVWCEKDALSSIFEPVTRRWHVRLLAAKGYASITALYDAAKRLTRAYEAGKQPVVLYLGDHDPSGLDMTRDIVDRLEILDMSDVIVQRLALNIDQVRQYSPPPNPAKFSDTRAPEYVARYGSDSWELDAMAPAMLDNLVSDAVQSWLDRDKWDERVGLEGVHKTMIFDVSYELEERLGREDAANDEPNDDSC